MRGTPTQEITKTIWDLHNAGLGNVEIAEKLSLHRTRVSSALARGRQKGIIAPPERNHDLGYLIRREGRHMGTFSEISDRLTLGQRHWLVTQAVDLGCATLAEFLTEVIRDQYEEVKVRKEQKNG